MGEFEHLTLNDRCEKRDCNAAAYVRVSKDGFPLDFCAHHFADNWAELMAAGFEVEEDIRETLKTPA